MKKLHLGLLIPLTALLFTFGASCGMIQKDSSDESTSSESVLPNDSSVDVHTHVWSDATCTAPKTCACGETDGESLGHSYGEVSYVWSEDLTTCTASRTCANDSAHVETETVEAKAVETSPTCLEDGNALYTATFENEAFAEQTKSKVLPASGHSYNEVKFDENSHWYACICGVEDSENKEAHYGGEATGTERAICEGCDEPYGDVLKPLVTGVAIKNTDSEQYNAETKTFTVKADGSGDMPILEVTGENLYLFSSYDVTVTTWMVLHVPEVGLPLIGFKIEENAATYTYHSADVSWLTTEPHEIEYTNDNGKTWIPTGYYVVKEKVPEITSVVIQNTDSEQYNAETKTFTVKADGSGDKPILEVTGENFDLFSSYSGDNTWTVQFAADYSCYLASGWWRIEGNAATYTYDAADIGRLTTEPFEIKYTNDGHKTWISTGYYVVLETVEVTEVPEITSVVIQNTDSEQYNAETKTFTVKADGSGDMPILEVTGENFDLFSNYDSLESTWQVWYASGGSISFTAGWWTIEGNTAILEIPSDWISRFSTESWEIQYTNDNGTTWISTGYYVVLES